MSAASKRLTSEEWGLFEGQSMMPYITGMFKTFGDKLDKLLEDMSEMKTKMAVMETTRVNRDDCERKHGECIAKIAAEEKASVVVRQEPHWFFTLSFTQYLGMGLGVSAILAVLMGALNFETIIKYFVKG